MKFIELHKSLKERIENVYNLTGEDQFLIRQSIITIKNFLIKDFEEFDYAKLDADKLKPDDVIAAILTMPIGNEYRLVVFNYPNSETVKTINNFDFAEMPVVVVCVNGSNLKQGVEVDCSKLDRQDINKYILNYIAKSKILIQEQALDYLIDATNADMSKINNELNKLVAFVSENEVISIDTVTNLVSNSNEYAIYMLTNAIDNKDFSKYQTIVNEMSKNASMAELFSYMGKYFKRMQYISLNKNDEELSKILNIKPYAIKMSRQNIAKNGIKYYINLYQKYVDLDYKIKSGKISASNAMYELIF